jgi:hypothetical protein
MTPQGARQCGAQLLRRVKGSLQADARFARIKPGAHAKHSGE